MTQSDIPTLLNDDGARDSLRDTLTKTSQDLARATAILESLPPWAPATPTATHLRDAMSQVRASFDSYMNGISLGDSEMMKAALSSLNQATREVGTFGEALALLRQDYPEFACPGVSAPTVEPPPLAGATETPATAAPPTVEYTLKFSGAAAFTLRGSTPDGLQNFCKPATTSGGKEYIDYITLDQDAKSINVSMSVSDSDGPGKSPTTVLATIGSGFDSTTFIWEKGAIYSPKGKATWKSPTRIDLNVPAYAPVGSSKKLTIVGTITCNGY